MSIAESAGCIHQLLRNQSKVRAFTDAGRGAYWHLRGGTWCAFSSLSTKEENRGSHQFLNWWQQMYTGHLHLNGLKFPPVQQKNKGHPKGCPHFWCARRDLNSRNLEYMVFLKLLFAQKSYFASNIPIFPTDIFTLILLRVRVKIRVIFSPSLG